jgi:hypothetical protein
MVGAMILATAMPLWQAVSPDLQQAIQEEVQDELRRGRFRFGARGGGEGLEVLIPIAFFAMIALIVFVIARRRQAELRARAEFQKQILDKFSSGKEFADFLGTEGSQRFLESLSAHSFGSRERILRGTRIRCAGRALFCPRSRAVDIGRSVVSFFEEVEWRWPGSARRAAIAHLEPE